MAIIKNGRINIWNAVKKQFETVHPETETARITDFADGIVQKLALTSAMTAVTALQTDSWFGKLLKMALTASGVKYNIAQNGYICFGSFLGGLIIQWGQTNAERTTSFNIAFHRTVFVVLVSQRNARYSPAVPGVDFADVSLSSFYSYAATSATQSFKDKLWWFSVGE